MDQKADDAKHISPPGPALQNLLRVKQLIKKLFNNKSESAACIPLYPPCEIHGQFPCVQCFPEDYPAA